MRIIITLAFALIGAVLLAGGVYLATLGGSPFIAFSGAALLLVAVLAVRAALAFAQTFWLAGVGERALADLRRDAYGHLLRLPMVFFNDRRVGELAGRLAPLFL